MSDEPTRARYPDEEGHVERDGVRVFWERYGEGESALLFLPPWPLIPSRTWKAQIPYLARRYRVVAFDPRGNGRSDPAGDLSAQSPETYAEDAFAVLDASDTPSAVLVTAGPGAATALDLAVRNPERVSGIVFITPDPWPAEAYAEAFAKGELGSYEGLDRFNPAYWREDWDGFASWWARTVCAIPHSTRLVEDMTGWIRTATPEALIAYCFALGTRTREATLELAREVRCPVLVIYDDENVIAEGDTWTALAEATGGRLQRIAGANRFGAGRYPVEFNLALRTFVESTKGAVLA